MEEKVERDLFGGGRNVTKPEKGVMVMDDYNEEVEQVNVLDNFQKFSGDDVMRRIT